MTDDQINAIYASVDTHEEVLAYRRGYSSEYPYDNPYPKDSELYNQWEFGLRQSLDDEYESLKEEE